MRLKDISILSPQYTGKDLDTEVSFVPMESLRCGSIEARSISFREAKGKYTYFANGDLLIAKVTPCFENGNIAVAKNLNEGIGFGSSEIFVLRMSDSVNVDYMFYLTLTSDFKGKACSTMCGVGGLKRISPLFMRTYEWNLPDLEEQKKQVHYLNKQSITIDRRISLLTKKRDCYSRLKSSIINRAVTRGLNSAISFKDSRVEWIGKIPEHWEVSRLKDLGYLYSGLTGKSGDDFRCDDETKTKPYIPFTNVLNNIVVNLNQVNNVVMEDGEAQNKVQENDLIFLMSSEDYESIAKCAVVLGKPGEVYLNSFCRGLHFEDTSVYAPFVNYQLLSEKFRDSLRFEARGFTRINIKVDRISSQFVALPPFEEQQVIATYLDEKCAKIDAAVANIEKQIDAMKRLKRALINEVVTGKREV